MDGKSTISKTVSYRRCEISPKQGKNLQQLIGAALVKHPRPADRYEPLNAKSSELRCIGMHYVENNCLCGFMTSFERGAAQPVIADDAGAASLRLGALAPPLATNGAAQQQFVPGVLYFVAHQNHVAIVQSHSMRSGAFETHLNWLLKSRTSELPATSTFALSNEAQKATKAKIRQSHVKAIAIGQPLMSEVALAAPIANSEGKAAPAAKKRSKAESKFTPTGPMLDLIRNFFEDQSDFEKLGLEDVFDGNLEVWIEIRYPKRKRIRPEDSVKLMDALGIALRDIEGDQVSLELANGHKVSGNDLKISGTVDAQLLNNKLPDEKQLLSAMIAWLTAQIENGVVDP